MASQRQHPIGKWPTRKDRQLAWALPSRKRVGSPIQPPRRPLQVVHEPAERSSQQHGLPPAKRRRRESINSHRQASYYSQQQDATHDSDDHDNFDDLDVSDDEKSQDPLNIDETPDQAASDQVHPSQAQPQDDLDTGSEDDTRDHDGSSLFDNGPNVGQENAQETLHSNGQLADTYDTAAEAIEGVIEDEQPEHEDFVEGYGSEEDEDDNDQETSMLVDGNEESLQESIQRGSTSATSGIDDVQDQEKDMMQGLQGAESSSERHDEQDAGINTATATATTTATTIATVSAQRESGNLESPDQDATTITVRESQAEGRPVKRNSGTFDFEIDDDTPNPSTSTPYSVVKQSWTEENDWDELKPLKGLGPIKVGDFALIALGEKKYRLKPPMAKIIDIRRGSTDACRTWVVIQWPYLVSEAVEVLKQARHPNAQRLVDGWPSRMRLLSDVYQILPAKSILKKVAPGKIHGEKMFKLGLEEGLNGRDNPGAAVVDAPKKSRKKT